MHQAVNGGRGGHRILEDRFPFRKSEIAGQHHRAAFVALGQEWEEHLHLLATLLDVTDVVDHQGLEGGESLENPAELQIAFGNQQFLDQQTAGTEMDFASVAHQFLGNGGQEMRFAAGVGIPLC